MNITIHPEQPDDIDDVFELNKLVFNQENEARLVGHVRQGPNFIPELSLVAYLDGLLIGYILFSKITITNGDYHHQSLGITSMVVHPAYQKKGVGAKMITFGLQKATGLGYTD